MRTYNRKHYICEMDGCLEKHYALGLCHRHWNFLKFKEKQDNSLWAGIEKVDMQDEVSNALAILDEREAAVFYSRLAGNTLGVTGEKLGISRERVRQIEEFSLLKMRKWILIKREEKNK